MKGQKEKEKAKLLSDRTTEKQKKSKMMDGMMKFSPLDLFPLEPTKENVIQYIVDTHWVEAQCMNIMGRDNPLLDDNIQYIYTCIFDKIDRLLELYETKGILSFCGYIKQIVSIQSRWPISIKQQLYGRVPTIGMSLEMEHAIDEQYNPEIDELYHLK